jgi:DNA-directed RNA polymerase specialized sigma24 family protein
VRSASTRLRRSAYLMCRDWRLAQDLSQHTLAKMYAAWDRIRDGTNLEAYSPTADAAREDFLER